MTEKIDPQPRHGYGTTRGIEQISGDASEWGVSENNRKVKYSRVTRAGRCQLKKETRQWEQTTAIISRFLRPGEASS